MNNNLLHIYRNTPFGRETLLQSIFFCQRCALDLEIYLPTHKKFLMYFEHQALQIDLDSSYLQAPERARDNLKRIFQEQKFSRALLFMENDLEYSATTLPDLPSTCSYMTCPRSISDKSGKIGLGHIGPKVRKILQVAPFPVLIPSQSFKPWQSIAILFGGSQNSLKALKIAINLAKTSATKLQMFTQHQGRSQASYKKIIKEHGLWEEFAALDGQWYFFDQGEFQDNLFQVPHDALLILGLFGHGLIKDVLFGSTMELVQNVMPNNMLLVGPRYTQ